MDLTPITDFFTNIKEKITNPFFGTLILVTLSRNWSLFYSLFNFNANDTREYKLRYISDYLSKKSFIIELSINVFSSCVIVVVGYLIVILFRTLSIWIEANAMPYLTGLVASKKTVLKDVYDDMKDERDDYSERYEEQRKRVRDYSKYNDSLISSEQEQSKRNSQLVSEIGQLEEKNRHDMTELENHYKNIIKEEKYNTDIIKSDLTENLTTIEKILEDTRITHINEVSNLIDKNNLETNSLKEEIKILNEEKTQSFNEISTLHAKLKDNQKQNLIEIEKIKQKLSTTSRNLHESGEKNKKLEFEISHLRSPGDKIFRIFDEEQVVMNIFQYHDTDSIKYYDLISREFINTDNVFSQIGDRYVQVIESGEEFDLYRDIVMTKTLP